MKTLYVLFVLFIIISIGLIIASFIYFEKSGHETIHYVYRNGGVSQQDYTIDRYVTEEHVIYKSINRNPHNIVDNIVQTELTCQKKTGQIKAYEREAVTDGVKNIFKLSHNGSSWELLAIINSKYFGMESLNADRASYPFNKEDIVTWMPLVDAYDYRMGGTQTFNAIKYEHLLMPPSPGKVTLTSIRDEYIDIDGKKIKSEHLIIKERDGSKYPVWVRKSDRFIIRAVLPPDRTFNLTENRGSNNAISDKKKMSGKSLYWMDRDIVYNEISFASGNREMTGILTRPRKRAIYPAVILVGGEQATDENNLGLFLDVADYLTRNGFVVFRYRFHDKNLNKGRILEVSLEDEQVAINSVVGILQDYRFVDVNRIGIISHSDACSVVAYYLKDMPMVKCVVMLSPRRLAPFVDMESEYVKKIIENMSLSDPAYENIMIRSYDNVLGKVERAVKDHVNVMGEKVYVKRMVEILKINSFEDIKNIRIPLLILQGKNDTLSSEIFVKAIEDICNNDEEKEKTIVFFRRLGHFLGSIKDDRDKRMRYTTDEEVLQTIEGWMGRKL